MIVGAQTYVFIIILDNWATLLIKNVKIYLKLFGSLLNVTDSCSKNLFIPPNSDCGECAIVLIEGSPSNTITRSARYVAIMKSCSTTNPVFLACKINLFITYKRKKNCKFDLFDLPLTYKITGRYYIYKPI